MTTQLLRSTVDTTAALLERTHWLCARFRKQARLRILCYHGVCADEDADQPWVPSYFVAASRFADQMKLLQRYGPVVFLPEFLQRAELVGEACTAVTFDDVAACTYRHALPVLERLGIRASFFVSTSYARTGRLFVADVLNLIGWDPELVSVGVRRSLASLLRDPVRHKRMPLGTQQTLLAEAEAMVRESADPHVVDALRCMNWDEVRTIDRAGHEIGGHTADHAILGWQEDRVRRAQILRCAEDIRTELGRAPIGFAYPNGGPGDFADCDVRVLRECGFRYAVSTQPGPIESNSDRFALPRCGVGIAHHPAMLALELTGTLDARRSTQAGWDSASAEVSPADEPAAEAVTREPASMRPEEYAVLDRLLQDAQPRHTLEIGMATGGSSARICAYLAAHGGGQHVAIDPFQFADDAWAGRGVARVQRAGLAQYLEVIAEPDYLALPALVKSGRRFDFILIDGWHSFDYTFVDLFYADVLLNSGGTLAIHDTNWPAVYRACRFLETHKAYDRIGPPISVSLPSIMARGLRRIRQIMGGPAAWHAARQRRTEWYALGAYRKRADAQVPNDFYARF
ncbi:MAG TPA: polysaccharide deacetylase family protein [Phycisphaerae bacterium]|nr:polysaccharide deacetylase family protein [Phycisphaerae bacterium]